jgi:hypothetical protein
MPDTLTMVDGSFISIVTRLGLEGLLLEQL